jgi:hypothetical protein
VTAPLRALAACVAAGVAVAVLALVVPLRAMGGDTVPGRYGAAVFACRGGFDLREVDWIAAAAAAGRRPYYVLPAKDGALVSMYGPAPALLGAPFLESLEPGAMLSDRDLAARTRLGAALSVGVAIALLAGALCARIPAPYATLLALAVGASFAGAGTLGQAPWQQTALLVPLTAAIATIAGARWRGGILLVATPALLVVAFFVRPAASLLLLALGATWALAWRGGKRDERDTRGLGSLAGAALLASVVALPQAVWSVHHGGGALPTGQLTSTAASMSDGRVFELRPGAVATALAGLLVSPARGALVFAPLLLVALWAAIRSGDRPARILAVGVVAHLVLIAVWRDWWGGLTFGPRLLGEALWVAPWMIARAWPIAGRGARTVLVASAAVTAAVGLLGALRYDAAWDIRRDPDHHHEALWDLRDSPLAAAVRGEHASAIDAPSGPYAYCLDRALERPSRR